jgi:uncharacterized OB-fold protein
MKSIDLSRIIHGGMREENEVIFNRPQADGSYRPIIQFFNKAAGLCLLCGDKPAPGDAYCPKCQAENDKLLEELNR